MDKIKPKIGFVGNINAMPFHYAIEFKKMGYDVKYIVEAPKQDSLNRPESHFSCVKYPYPDWIIEVTSLLDISYRMTSPLIFLRRIIFEMQDRDVLFLNDYGLALTKYFPKNSIKVAVFCGFDLSVLCNENAIDYFKANRSQENKLIKFAKAFFFKQRIKNTREGVQSCLVTTFFPKGLMAKADDLLFELMQGRKYFDLRRYDNNFKELPLFYSGAKETKKLMLLVPVRFLLSENQYVNAKDDYKGNDIIIRGIADFYKIYPDIEVHFFEKGSDQDLQLAKNLILESGLSPVVVWHKTMPLTDLIALYDKCDICFDQVGNHFMGAIGTYALYMGKPLIANARLDILKDFFDFKETIPILNATTQEEILECLKRCTSFSFRKEVGEASNLFSLKYFDVTRIINEYIKIINSAFFKNNNI